MDRNEIERCARCGRQVEDGWILADDSVICEGADCSEESDLVIAWYQCAFTGHSYRITTGSTVNHNESPHVSEFDIDIRPY